MEKWYIKKAVQLQFNDFKPKSSLAKFKHTYNKLLCFQYDRLFTSVKCRLEFNSSSLQLHFTIYVFRFLKLITKYILWTGITFRIQKTGTVLYYPTLFVIIKFRDVLNG